MYHFRIHFEYPWLLLLIVPALFFTLFHYFRSAKKYRRNRNRIISIVLHMLVMTLCVSVLSGLAFLYDVPNVNNEIVILVDMTDSNGEAETEKAKDDFILDVIAECGDNYRIGIVMFGYDQVLAAPMGYDGQEAFRLYQSAPLPDPTATDIASALNFARGLFNNPKTAKIVLLSDGLETDGDALSAVRAVAADGIRVDTVCFRNPEHNEVQAIGLVTPDYNVIVGDPFKMTFVTLSSIEAEAEIQLYDNDELGATLPVLLTKGRQEFVMDYAFTTLGPNGLHKLYFEVVVKSAVANTAEGNTDDGLDRVSQNNVYYSYIKIEQFDRILILERNAGEGEELSKILSTETGYTVETINITNQKDKVPDTVDKLRMYDQVVLVNIANADMPKGFDEILHSYTHDYGGGLFTVGGNKADGVANAYNRDDMKGTLYQQMLPVEAINYTPPLGAMFLVDVSGSMIEGVDATTGKTYLEVAEEAVKACVKFSLSERDYCGVTTLSDTSEEVAPMIPVPQMDRIIAAVDRIVPGGGTFYGQAIERAATSLMALTNVQKRHIILISDGEPLDPFAEYSKVTERYAKLGVTLTLVIIGGGNVSTEMRRLVEIGNGRLITVSDISLLTGQMRNELELDEIKSVNYGPFVPTIYDHTSVVSGIMQEDIPELDGFYGTKIKQNTTVPLMGEYVPIYAQWKYGRGSVGSFMCDLNGVWSSKFLESETGKQILRNIAISLFPTQKIRPSEIDVEFTGENYTTIMSVLTELEEGETISAQIKSHTTSGEVSTPLPMSPDNGYSRVSFAMRDPGVHEVVVRKLDGEGEPISSSITTAYRVFSYSKEYNILNSADGEEFLSALAAGGKGNTVTESWEVLEGFERFLHREYDPRLILCIIALALFLLDIAVRKFKFKWPHELIREHRERKAKKENAKRR